MLSRTSPIPFDLRQGVVNPENLSLPDPSLKKKKKKRQREENGQDSHNSKKRKHRNDSLQDEDPSAVDPTVKKKKKKKDKGRDLPQTEPSIDDVNAQATALLSAIVAAAAGNPAPDPPQMAFPPPYHPHMPPPEHFGQYQAMQDGFNPYTQPHIFPTPTDAAGAFSDINFGSNEDVLRALQDLDISKIANVLRTLGEAAAAAANPQTYPPQPGFVPPPMPEPVPPTPLGQLPIASNAILGLPPKAPEPSNVPPRKSERSFGATDSHTSPDHAYLLANKWLNASKLSELVTTQGVGVSFQAASLYLSVVRSRIQKGEVFNYRRSTARSRHRKLQSRECQRRLHCFSFLKFKTRDKSKQLTDEQIQELIFPQNEKNKDNAFWSELSEHLPRGFVLYP
jgi:hypothetical protein